MLMDDHVLLDGIHPSLCTVSAFCHCCYAVIIHFCNINSGCAIEYNGRTTANGTCRRFLKDNDKNDFWKVCTKALEFRSIHVEFVERVDHDEIVQGSIPPDISEASRAA